LFYALAGNRFLSETKSTAKLAIPIIIAQLGIVLMAVSDNIMVGRFIGKNALGAAGLANALAYLISSIAIGGLPVAGPLIAKSKTINNLQETKAIYLATLRTALFFCIIIGLIGAGIYYNFDLFGQSEQVSDIARTFFLIILTSSIPVFFFTAFKQLSDGLSLTKVAMYITFLGLFLNIPLNYILIHKIGVQGAAWATLLVRIIMACTMAYYIFRSASFREIRQTKADTLRIKELTGKIIKLSVPGGLQFFFEVGAFSFAIIMMGWINEDALAAHQVAVNIVSTTYMMAAGIGYASGIRVGGALGANSLSGIKRAAVSGFTLVFLFMSLCSLIIFLFPSSFIRLYINHPDIESVAVSLLLIAAFFQISDGVQVVALGVLRGISDVNTPAIITFISYWVISLPLGYLLAFKLSFGPKGIWIGLLAGLSFAAIFLSFRFFKKLKELDTD
jgi:MATE family multidrug resistance protein